VSVITLVLRIQLVSSLERGKVRIERKLIEKKEERDPRGERGRTNLKIKVEGKIGA